MKPLSVKIPDDLYELLEQKTATSGNNQSAVIRLALEEYLKRKGTAVKAGSFAELGRDLCGSIHAPSDLSTNSKYMDGYGGR